MGDRKLEMSAYRAVSESVVREGGSATSRGEQYVKEHKSLHQLVDPKGFGCIRRSLNRFEEVNGKYRLTVAPAILKETRFDTTGSMGGNVDLAFEVLPRSYNLLHGSKGSPLARYDLQIMNSIFGDVCDDYVLCRSQAEMDEKIAEQLRLMLPEKGGGDADEDPQYGLFAGAYLTSAYIVKAELKSYDFTVTDARGRDRLDSRTLVRVFGDEVYDHLKENGHQIKKSDLPSTREVVQDLLKISHAFLIQIDDRPGVNEFWTGIYGENRVVSIPSVKYLPEVEAAIIGLTEGTINLQNLEEFLQKEGQVSAAEARKIQRSVASIPIGAQQQLPNFNKLPKKGDLFASKTDVWPIKSGHEEQDLKKPTPKPGKMWR